MECQGQQVMVGIYSVLFILLAEIAIVRSGKMPPQEESISIAADAIGMYLRKIANNELFVSKMQDIFNHNVFPHPEQSTATPKGINLLMFIVNSYCTILLY